jgi:hypothetical protein
MLLFRSLELTDKDSVDACLRRQNYRASDFCFTNLYCWGKKFDTQFAITNHWLFVRFKDNNGRNSYLKPVGTGNLTEALALIREDHSSLFDTPFQLRGLTKEMIAEIEAALPGVFEYKLNRSVSDYIYTSKKLIELTGKKLQSKRNHINRFKRENDWQYRSLAHNPALVQECKKMLDQWMEINREEDPSLVYDDCATTLMLDNFDYFGLKGGLICVDGRIAAFSLGEPLTEDTFVVHVEKAFTSVHGAYAIINQQFAENEAAGFRYVNREEDMGIENLCRAKMSYQPDILLEKYNARFK